MSASWTDSMRSATMRGISTAVNSLDELSSEAEDQRLTERSRNYMTISGRLMDIYHELKALGFEEGD